MCKLHTSKMSPALSPDIFCAVVGEPKGEDTASDGGSCFAAYAGTNIPA